MPYERRLGLRGKVFPIKDGMAVKDADGVHINAAVLPNIGNGYHVGPGIWSMSHESRVLGTQAA
jgi:hypothetical protein